MALLELSIYPSLLLAYLRVLKLSFGRHRGFELCKMTTGHKVFQVIYLPLEELNTLLQKASDWMAH
jgi:hypothetical protein